MANGTDESNPSKHTIGAWIRRHWTLQGTKTTEGIMEFRLPLDMAPVSLGEVTGVGDLAAWLDALRMLLPRLPVSEGGAAGAPEDCAPDGGFARAPAFLAAGEW